MAKSSKLLGDTELEILNIVWDIGGCTVSDVHAIVSGRRQTAYTTIMTVMKNLARKGYLSYTKRGKSYVYAAERTAGDVRGSLVRDLARRAFDDSPLSLALTMVKNQQLDADELAELRRAIAEMESDEQAK